MIETSPTRLEGTLPSPEVEVNALAPTLPEHAGLMSEGEVVASFKDEHPLTEACPSAVLERLEDAIARGFADLLGELRDRQALDRAREEQFARLHAELEGYRAQEGARPLRQLLSGVIRLHDHLGKTVGLLRQKPAEELTADGLLGQLDSFSDDVELLLAQHGVQPFEEPGERFDPRRQTVIRRVPSSETEYTGIVAERLRPGFEQGEVLLEKERVAVYVAAPKQV